MSAYKKNKETRRALIVNKNPAPKNQTQPKKKEQPKNYGLYDIKNNKLFQSDDPNGTHMYVVYSDNKGNVLKAVETTHLYAPEKVEKIRKKIIKPVQFGGVEFPSGVMNSYYTKDVNDNPLKTKDKGIKQRKATMSEKQAIEINEFAKEKRR